MINCITDKKEKGPLKKETFLDHSYEVISRSGLNRTEIQLIKVLQKLTRPKSMLFLENRTGVSSIIARDLYPETQITLYCLDLYYANKIKRNLDRNNLSSVTVLCKPFLDYKDYFDVIFLQVTKGGATREFLMDLLQQSYQALKMGGKCFISIEGKDPWFYNQMKNIFRAFSLYFQNKTLSCIEARKKQKLKRVRNFQSESTMPLFGKKPVRLLTLPGVFSHRQVDQGALALAEVVESRKGDAVLDMGCGYGVIGISIAVNQDISRVCFVDSNSRAIYITEKNCLINDVKYYEMILSDQGIEERSAFTLFTGNPPYFSHFKIAELFVHTAYHALMPEGRAYIVAKTATWHYKFMKRLFGNAELIERRGYQIVKSIR